MVAVVRGVEQLLRVYGNSFIQVFDMIQLLFKNSDWLIRVSKIAKVMAAMPSTML